MKNNSDTHSAVDQSNPSALWNSWVVRWDRFQESYVPSREQQFALMIDYLTNWRKDKPLSVLDLACGPGSFGVRLARHRPESMVVCLDFDPWLLEMGQQTTSDQNAITWVDADLREVTWTQKLPYSNFDAIVMMTALPWFDHETMKRIYQQAANILKEEGLFFLADILPSDSTNVRMLARELLLRWQHNQRAQRSGEAWYTFWAAVEQVPQFHELIRKRERRIGRRKEHLFMPSSAHHAALMEAGFSENGEIWRYHESAILLSIR